MRFKEIVEAGVMNKLGQAVGTVQNPEFQAGLNKGSAMAKKLFTPSQWLKSGSSDKKTAGTNNLANRQTLVAVASDRNLYGDDLSRIQSLYNGVKNGSIRPTVDPAALMTALQTAYNRRTLSGAQKQLLLQFSKQFN